MKKENKFLYVLKLENDCFYIGQTKDMDRRLEEHMAGKAAVWSSINKPVKIIEFWSLGEYTQKTAMQFENELTIKYMCTYGIENVRGGDFCITNNEHHLGLVKSKTRIVGENLVPIADHFVKKKFSQIKLGLETKITENTHYTYVLELDNSNIYINTSNKVIKDIKRHFFGNGSRWSSIHRPKDLLEIIENKSFKTAKDKSFENLVVEKYMRSHGIENVRGGHYILADPNAHMTLVRKKLAHLFK